MQCLGKSSFRKKYISDPDTYRMTTEFTYKDYCIQESDATKFGR